MNNMKTLNSLRVVIAIITLGLFTWNAGAQNSAQLQEKTVKVGEFSSLEVTGDFEVTLAKGDYSTKVTVSSVLADYIEVYVRTGVLHIGLNEKAIPKDVKKDLKGKNAPEQVFRAVVYTPRINSITLEDNAVLTGLNEFSCSSFALKLEDKAQLKTLSVIASSATVSLRDKSQATILLTVNNDIELKTDGSSTLRATVDGQQLSLNVGGTSKSSVDATVETVALDADGRAELTLSGKARTLTVKGNRNMNVDASALPVEEVDATLGGGDLSVKVEKIITADLTGGAELYFNGTPEIKLKRVVKSTLAPVSEKKK